MATTTTASDAFRVAQARRATAIAGIVALLYRRLNLEDPRAVERWLALVLPRIAREQERMADWAIDFVQETRRKDLPREPEISFSRAPGSNLEQMRRSLQVVGPESYLNKAREFRNTSLPDAERRAMEIEARQVTANAVAGAVVRHSQSASRNTILEAAKTDRKCLGWVRLTRGKPCFFCAVLASRGHVYDEFSFDLSDPRFQADEGSGEVKVHDFCQCSLKAIYRKDDEAVEANEPFADMWTRWGAGGGQALQRFRRGYDHWLKTGEFLDWDTVDDIRAYRARRSTR